MEKIEQIWEREEVEEQEDEETPVLVRKSINKNDSKTTEIAAIDVEVVSNGVSEPNGDTELAANGAKSEDSILEEEQKVEELDGVLENESEAINGEQKPEDLVFYDKTEGVEPASTYIGEKQIVKDPGHNNKLDASSLDFVVHNGSASTIDNNKYKGVLENDIFSRSNPQTSFQENGTDYKASKEIESAEVDVDDLEVAEFDVERVIQEQTTHDLYCPNCNSCITKRVILRKRKRRIRVSDEEAKQNKIEDDFTLVTGSVQPTAGPIRRIDEVTDNDTELLTTDERKRRPDIFRCLSCFSFFIPTMNGFKLFPIFGDKVGKENVQDEQAPTVEKSTSMFPPNKPETAPEQGSSIQTDVPKGAAGIDDNFGNQSGQSSSSKLTNGKSAEDAFSFSQSDGLKMVTKIETPTVENSDEGQIPDQTARLDKDTVLINIDPPSVGPSQTIEDKISPTETPSLLQPATQIIAADRERTEERKELEIEVIKSLVYGGLAESITSLSVVSSAAGGGAATLNTLALGAANLIGGLFVICHNLWELKSDHIEQVANQVSEEAPEQRNRYKELLGRRRNFILHSVVAIISYLVFGSVAPVVYGFSFHKTDDKQLKLIVTAAASLLCIILLAIGRAHIMRPNKPYLKSVVTFVVVGFMVSGASYAAGELVERLLEKLGLFQPSSASNLLLNEMFTTGSERASY